MTAAGERAPDPRTARRMRAVLLAVAALTAAYVAVAAGGATAGTERFSAWVGYAVAAAAVAICAWRALVDDEDRIAWALIALAVASWGLGDAGFSALLEGGEPTSTPSIADGLYLAFYPLTYVALVLLARRHGGRRGAGVWLDGLVGAGALAALMTALWLEPLVQRTGVDSTLGVAVDLAYPTADGVLIAMLIVMVATARSSMPRQLVVLLAGIVAFDAADSTYLAQIAHDAYRAGGVVDAAWFLGLLLIAAAATVPAPAPRRRGMPAHSRPVVPSLAAATVLGILVVEIWTERNTLTIALALGTIALAIVRMAVSLHETNVLLTARAHDAVADALTGLGNRRRLIDDLAVVAEDATEERPALFTIFDLDGFKAYNDTFGHGAGDALLVRIAAALRDAVGPRGRAYRIGGDEFCALLDPRDVSPERVGASLAAAMRQHGGGFEVGASWGCALAPRDGRDSSVLLRRADEEMYARKGQRRPGAERQARDVLLAALREREPALGEHARGVAGLAATVGRALRLGATDQRALTYAAALHDVGKIAIPGAILDKPGPLTAQERAFVHDHPLIAQRILGAAPALGYAAQLVRSAQERWDGTGYPDRLAGDEIPRGARVIAACNAYVAMTSDRPYQRAIAPGEAVAELRRCSGTQFDPQVVEALLDVLAHPERYASREGEPDVAGELLGTPAALGLDGAGLGGLSRAGR